MSENKCCGNCKNYKKEDLQGVGKCVVRGYKQYHSRNKACQFHELKNSGWIEITTDNVDELYGIDREESATCLKKRGD